jgi:xylulokinase
MLAGQRVLITKFDHDPSRAVGSARHKRCSWPVGALSVVTFLNAAGLTVHAGPTQSGGDSLRWWGEAIGRDVGNVLELANNADRDGQPVLFLPQLGGDRASLWDSDLRGAFVGLHGSMGAPDFALAVIEGVAL